jgi:hypothetical protein
MGITQSKLEHREMKFYKKNYPGLNVECRGPSYPSLVYPLGTGWVSVLIDDSDVYKKFLNDFKINYHVQENMQIGICKKNCRQGMAL